VNTPGTVAARQRQEMQQEMRQRQGMQQPEEEDELRTMHKQLKKLQDFFLDLCKKENDATPKAADRLGHRIAGIVEQIKELQETIRVTQTARTAAQAQAASVARAGISAAACNAVAIQQSAYTYTARYVRVAFGFWFDNCYYYQFTVH